ncbi:hypothetical protein [Maribacter sp. R77961]|uniref:hypothetical protein n=1 Tax=Maribacter sp. R77961 TaxID=3093871 RepID=UPI0037C73C72
MFAKLNTSQRIQIGLVLAMAFLLVLGSNRLDQRHFSTVQTTVNSVYKDRVVAQNIIYKLNNIFHAKELRLIRNNDFKESASENNKIVALLSDFEITELTMKESKLLRELKFQFLNLQKLAQSNSRSITKIENSNDELTMKTVKEIKEKLNGLSQIQLRQSEQLTALSNKSLGMNILLSKLEVAFLVIIGIAMLALIFYPRKQLETQIHN